LGLATDVPYILKFVWPKSFNQLDANNLARLRSQPTIAIVVNHPAKVCLVPEKCNAFADRGHLNAGDQVRKVSWPAARKKRTN
jgi:hypothetical protein